MFYKNFNKFSSKTTVKSHPFYIVKPSAYAIFVSIFAGLTAFQLVEYFHTGDTYQLYIAFFGFIGTMTLWFGSIMKESNNPDIYTISVRENYIFGVLLFIISEVMIFFAFFWTYLHSSLNPTYAIGSIWPPYNISPMNTFRWPFFNTTLLLLSGVTVNVFYYTLKSLNVMKINKLDITYMQSFIDRKKLKTKNNFTFSYKENIPSFLTITNEDSFEKKFVKISKTYTNFARRHKVFAESYIILNMIPNLSSKQRWGFHSHVLSIASIFEFVQWRLKLMYSSLLYTIVFGILFIYCQYYEYTHASFDITDGIYGSIFYTLTGLHGLHVIIGVILLIIVFFRLVFKQYNFTFSPHIGITAAVWYWHFVDLIWVFVYFIVYLWGNSL